MSQQNHKFTGPYVSAQMVEHGVMRGRQLQAEAMRNAFKRLFESVTGKRPVVVSPVRHGSLAQNCAQVIP